MCGICEIQGVTYVGCRGCGICEIQGVTYVGCRGCGICEIQGVAYVGCVAYVRYREWPMWGVWHM